MSRCELFLCKWILEEALLGFDKMSSSWTTEGKQKKDNKVMTWIHLHVSNDILQDVLREKNIVALRLKLVHLYMTKRLLRKLHLRQQLYSHHLAEGTFMIYHISTFKEIVAGLETMEVKYDVEDLGLIFFVLIALPRTRLLETLFCIVVILSLWKRFMKLYVRKKR